MSPVRYSPKRELRRCFGAIVSVALLFGCSKPKSSVIADAGTKESLSNEAIAQRLGLPAADVQRLREERSLDNDALLAMPQPRLASILRDLNHPDDPGKAVEFRLLQQRSENGSVPPNALMQALVKLETMRKDAARLHSQAGIPVGPPSSMNSLLPGPPEAGLNRGAWRSLRSGTVGGRTRAIVVLTGQILVASPAGGIWRSRDDGATWIPVDDFMANLAVSSIAVDPANPSLMYAGTGEGYYNVDAIQGAGIFRSTDGGIKWAALPGTKNFLFVNRVAVTSDGKVVLAATRSGLFRSLDRGDTWSPADGDASDPLFEVTTHPSSSRLALAAGNGFVLASEDAGATWKRASGIPSGAGRVEVAFSRADPKVAYASVDAKRGTLLRSSDGGASFILQNDTIPYLGKQGWYDNAIWADDPKDSNLVLVGGIDVWRSFDGGVTLKRISLWSNDKSTHADQHAFAAAQGYDGQASRSVLVGNDGGIYRIADVRTASDSSGWTSLNHDYGATQFYTAAISPTTGTIIGGTQDNGTLRYDAATGWSTMAGGDGGWCAVDRETGYFYGEYIYLDIERSTDDGRSADSISGQYWDGAQWRWKQPPYVIADAQTQKANFIAPFTLDPNKPMTLLAGGLSLWRTKDARAQLSVTSGPTWETIKDPAQAPISAIAIAEGDSNLVWVAHNDGEVYRTNNGTAPKPGWVRVDVGAPLPNTYCHHISIDPRDHSVVYVTFGALESRNVWRTADGGATAKSWTNIGASLPAVPVRTLAIHPRNSKYLYVGTELGVFGTENLGRRWSPTNEGPTNCSVDDLVWRNDSLYAVTHGRGVFRIDIPQP